MESEQPNIVTASLKRIRGLPCPPRPATHREGLVLPTELAQLLGKQPFTVRNVCRLGRVHAEQRMGSGRREWMIAHAELVRYQNEGLLPVPKISAL